MVLSELVNPLVNTVFDPGQTKFVRRETSDGLYIVIVTECSGHYALSFTFKFDSKDDDISISANRPTVRETVEALSERISGYESLFGIEPPIKIVGVKAPPQET
jgi:hypothetical protein